MESTDKQAKIIDQIKGMNCSRLLLLLPLVVYLPGILGWIAYPAGTNTYTDLLLTHYSNAMYLRKTLINELALPFWSNLIYSGAPFAANPLSGLWYLPGWVALLFPLPEGISVALALHSIFGSWGMYKFLRKEKINHQGSIFGGIAFGLMPKAIIHYGAGHVTLLYAIAWTPWLFYSSKSDKQGWTTGLIAGLIFLADPRWAALIALMWLTYDIAHRQFINIKSIFFYFKSALIAFLIASPLIFPLLEFVKVSTRSELTQNEQLIYSLPPEKLLGLIIPVSGGNLEWFSYSGGLISVLFILYILYRPTRKIGKFWLIWAGISTLMSLGSFLPGSSIITNLPIFSLLRVPARALFLTCLCLIVIGTNTIDTLINGEYSEKILKYFSFSVLVFSIMFGLFLYFSTGRFNAIWGFIIMGVTSLVIFLKTSDLNMKNSSYIFIAILVVDIMGASLFNLNFNKKTGIISEKQAVFTYLNSEQDRFRLYSPSYSIPQYLAAAYGYELSDGVEPMQVRTYQKFMEGATGITSPDYSVTIPSFETGNPAIDNVGSIPNPMLLGIINVKYLISEFPVNVVGLNYEGNISGSYIYKNEYFQPRAWVQPIETTIEELTGENISTSVRNIDWSPNQIEIVAQGPGTLVLSEIDYPGWSAKVDGNWVDIETEFELLRSVKLPAGEHKVQFNYRPASVYLGLLLAAVGWIIYFWMLFKKNDTELP